MKKWLLSSVVLILFLIGCGKKDSLLEDNFFKDDYLEEVGDIQKVDLTNLSLDTEDVEDILGDYSNLTISEKLEIKLPKSISTVDTYYLIASQVDRDVENYYDEFLIMFDYLFPGKMMNTENFLYTGGNSEEVYDDSGNIIQNYNRVNDYYEQLMKGKIQGVQFFYDDGWFQNLVEWKDTPVALELGNPIGYGRGVIIKGKTLLLSGYKIFDSKLNQERYPILSAYDPTEHLEYIATYPVNSKEEFQLVDRKMPICEAVDFFESYINGLPCPKEKNAKTVVIEVDVYRVTEDLYGYCFFTTEEYQGILFDYMKSGTVHSGLSDYATCGGQGFMVESTDIDYVRGYYQKECASLVKTYNEIVSFETAVHEISKKMSQEAEFRVDCIELVYSMKPKKDQNGYFDIQNEAYKMTPAWKFTLFNQADSRLYVCYINAIHGGDFRYYYQAVKWESQE